MTQITITLDDEGDIQLTGPLDQTMLCLGLLEMARLTITQRVLSVEGPEPSRIEVPELTLGGREH